MIEPFWQSLPLRLEHAAEWTAGVGAVLAVIVAVATANEARKQASQNAKENILRNPRRLAVWLSEDSATIASAEESSTGNVAYVGQYIEITVHNASDCPALDIEIELSSSDASAEARPSKLSFKALTPGKQHVLSAQLKPVDTNQVEFPSATNLTGKAEIREWVFTMNNQRWQARPNQEPSIISEQ